MARQARRKAVQSSIHRYAPLCRPASQGTLPAAYSELAGLESLYLLYCRARSRPRTASWSCSGSWGWPTTSCGAPCPMRGPPSPPSPTSTSTTTGEAAGGGAAEGWRAGAQQPLACRPCLRAPRPPAHVWARGKPFACGRRQCCCAHRDAMRAALCMSVWRCMEGSRKKHQVVCGCACTSLRLCADRWSARMMCRHVVW